VNLSAGSRGRGLTFDMRGGRKWAKPACGRPLDGRVRPHCGGGRYCCASHAAQRRAARAVAGARPTCGPGAAVLRRADEGARPCTTVCVDSSITARDANDDALDGHGLERKTDSTDLRRACAGWNERTRCIPFREAPMVRWPPQDGRPRPAVAEVISAALLRRFYAA